MKSVMAGGLILVALGTSCAGLQNIGFGPFPSTSLSGSVAGVASFVPGTVPGAGEFALVVYNTDSTNAYDATVTPAGGTALTKTVPSCGIASFAPSCTVASVVVTIAVSGSTTPPTLTVTPPATCSQQIVFIVPATTSSTSATSQPSLMETVPTSLAACGTSTGT